MKKVVLCVISLFLFSNVIFSQIILKGKVVNEKSEPLENAAIYINNTTFGTFTDKNGEYQLKINEGKHVLIVSFLGYKTITEEVNTSEKTKIVYFVLQSKENVLDEIVIKKVVYDNDWKYNLVRFKKAFLGTTILAQNCKILNPKTLSFEYNYKTKTFTAFAKEPLRIKNKGLGYLITYDLVDFTQNDKQTTYLGYAKYKNLKKKIKKRWIKNRKKAYNGSRMHFLRSLRNKSLKKEGFNVNQFKRVLNPERPLEDEISRAKELIRLHRSPMFFGKKIEPKTPLDSALVVVQKSRLPKYRDYLYKKNVPYHDMIQASDKNIFLQFKDYLSIIYTKETEEENYARRNIWKPRTPLNVQTSAIVMKQKRVVIDMLGEIADPLAIFAEGYWSYEKLADMLPLNYFSK